MTVKPYTHSILLIALHSLFVSIQVDRFFLAQDRIELRTHLRRAHDVEVDLGELKYQCRFCEKDFAGTEAFLRHDCCRHNGQEKLLPQPLMGPNFAFG